MTVDSRRLEEIASSRYIYYHESAGLMVAWHGSPQFTIYNEDLEEVGVFNADPSNLPNKEQVGHMSCRAHLDTVIENYLEGYIETHNLLIE